MLYLSYLGEAKKIEFKETDKKLLAVRKPVSGIPKGFIHVPQLSPSLPLFEQTQIWKRGIFKEVDKAFLKSIGQSIEDPTAWWFLYEQAFNKELVARPDMVRAIKRLSIRLTEGEEIYVFCYCKNVCRCHRGLIGTYMKEKGFDVDFRIKKEVKEKTTEQLSLFEA